MQLKLIRQALKSLFATHPAVFGDAEERDLLAASIAGPKTKVISALAHALIKPDGTIIPADQVGSGGGGSHGGHFSFFAKGNDGVVSVPDGVDTVLDTWSPVKGASSYSAGVVTVDNNGDYLIKVTAGTADPLGEYYAGVNLEVNGESIYGIERSNSFPAETIRGTIVVPLSAGDEVSVTGSQSSGDTITFGATEFDTFSITQIA